MLVVATFCAMSDLAAGCVCAGAEFRNILFSNVNNFARHLNLVYFYTPPVYTSLVVFTILIKLITHIYSSWPFLTGEAKRERHY